MLLGLGGGAASFFGGVAAVLLLTLLGVAILRGHMPRESARCGRGRPQ